MKLPDSVLREIHELPCWITGDELADLDAIELIIRHCAAVREGYPERTESRHD